MHKLSTTDFSFLHDLFIDVHSNARLEGYTTFRLGGPCPFLITCQTPYQLEQTIKRLTEHKIDFILIGGGSNLLVSDEGIDLVVVRYIGSPMIERQGNDLVVSGSTLLDHLAQFAVKSGLEGLNCTTGIPGTVGGAVVGNAGAFGKQVGDVLTKVLLIDKKGAKREALSGELGFTYRNSNLKETGDIVLAARFALKGGDNTVLQKERDEILEIRRQKHPNLSTHPCAGSFFRNIEPTSKAERRQAAGWFLEEAGAKDMRVGGAFIFEKHANIIVKSDECLAQDVYELSRQMAKAVKQKFDLTLIREVRLVGKFDGMPKDIKTLIW